MATGVAGGDESQLNYWIEQLFRSRSRISERIVGEPMEVGPRTIRPVVRVSGRRGGGDDGSAGGTGVMLKVEPAGLIVFEGDGREHRIGTPDATRLILRGLVGVALVVVVASEAVVRVLR